MRVGLLLAALMIAAPLLAELEDDRQVAFDEKTDFSLLKTFAIREGVADSRKAELYNKLTIRTIENAIRSTLLSKGLKESPDRADVIVTFSLTETQRREVIGRGACCGGDTVQASRGVLVIDLTKRDGNSPVWHGVYTDEELYPGRLAENLPGDAKRLLSEYPPRKKK